MGELQQPSNKNDPLSDEPLLMANNSKSFANERCIKSRYTYKVYVKTNAYV